MKNSAIDRTNEIFRADHVSMWRSCSRARRGPRVRAGPRPWVPRVPGASVAAPAVCGDPAADDPAEDGTVEDGTGGAPARPPTGRAGGAPVGAAGAPVGAAVTAVAPVL